MFYVGQGTNIRGRGRIERPWVFVQRGKFWDNVVASHGTPEVEIVGLFDSADDAETREMELIAAYGRRALGTGPLVNICSGGSGRRGFKHSPEAVEKMRRWRTGRKQRPETVAKRATTRTGMKVGAEGRENMRQAQLRLHASGYRVKHPPRTEAMRAVTRYHRSLQAPLSIEARAKLSASLRAAWARRKAAEAAVPDTLGG